MLTPKVGFVVYGTHRGVDDPMGQPFIDQKVIDNCKKALKKEGLELVETSPIVVDRADANKAILPLVKDDSIDAMILFSGTWIWAGEMIGAIREFAKTNTWSLPSSILKVYSALSNATGLKRIRKTCSSVSMH